MTAHDELERIALYGDPPTIREAIQWALSDTDQRDDLSRALDALMGSQGYCQAEAVTAAGAIRKAVGMYLESKGRKAA